MPIYFICILTVLILAFLFGLKDYKVSRRPFIISVSLLLLFFCGVRSIEVGTDTQGYVLKFYDALNMNWSDLQIRFIERYILKTDDTDIGFYALEKIVALFTSSFQLNVLIIDLLFFIPLGIMLYRYTVNIYQLVFAFIFFISMVYVFILLGGRQMVAMGFELISFMYVYKDKYIRALLCIFVGMFIHFSLLLFLPYLFACFCLRKWGKKIHAASLVLFPVILLNVNKFIFFLGDMAGSDRYRKYGEGEIQGGATTFIVMIFLLSVFCFIAIRGKHLQKSEWLQKMYMTLPFMTLTGPLIYSNGSMIRVCLYFYIFMMFLVPKAIESFFPRQYVKMAYILIIAILILLKLMSREIEYDFYWNDPPGTWRLS